MQTVTAAFTTAAAAAANAPNYTLGIAWTKSYDASAVFFTIGVSSIGSSDSIPSGAGVPTYFDKYYYDNESDNANVITVDRTMSGVALGVMSAQLDIELNNTTKKYLPTFDPVIGDYIKPGRPVKISIGFDYELLPQFVGFTGRPQLTLVNRTLKYHAFDAMEYLNDFESELSTQTDITTDEMIELLLIEAGFASTQFVLEASVEEPIKFVNPRSKNTGPLIKELVESEMGIFFFDELGVAHFWNRHHFNTSPTAVGTLSYDNMSDIKFLDTPVINYVRVTADPREIMEKQPVWSLASSILVPASQTVHYIGNFGDEDGELPVENLVTPVYSDITLTDSYYKGNTLADETGTSAESYLVLSNFTNFGTSFAVDITNTNPTTDMHLTKLLLYGDPAKVTSHITQEYKDQASIDENGLNPDNSEGVLIIKNNYIQTSSTALSYAINLVNAYSQPRRQFSMPIFPNPAYQFGDVLDIEIDDTSETLTGVIFSNKLAMNQMTVISQELVVEIRDLATFFTIGVSQIGGPDIIAP